MMILLKIGIECESIEGPQSWGVGRIVKKLLEEISNRPELANEFRFFLYFKSQIPDYPWLGNPIFVKKIVGAPSFSLYYYLFLPVKLWFEKLDLMFFPNYMLSPLFRGKSLVMLTEDIYYEIHSGTLPFRYKLAYKIFAGWWAARHTAKIIAISESSKLEVAKLFKINLGRIVVNQLGVDRPKQVSKLTTYNLKPKTYLLYVGQAFPRRHLRETMLAFELLTTNLQLVAVGKDKYNPPIIKKLAEDINKRLGRNAIIYKEYVVAEELACLYANAKCLIYVSSKEAFGLPPLEALAYGTVPVVADQPITREIFGDSAFFTKSYTPEAIAEAVKKALTDEAKRQEIIADADKILSKYTWNRHADRFLEITRNLLTIM